MKLTETQKKKGRVLTALVISSTVILTWLASRKNDHSPFTSIEMFKSQPTKPSSTISSSSPSSTSISSSSSHSSTSTSTSTTSHLNKEEENEEEDDSSLIHHWKFEKNFKDNIGMKNIIPWDSFTKKKLPYDQKGLFVKRSGNKGWATGLHSGMRISDGGVIVDGANFTISFFSNVSFSHRLNTQLDDLITIVYNHEYINDSALKESSVSMGERCFDSYKHIAIAFGKTKTTVFYFGNRYFFQPIHIGHPIRLVLFYKKQSPAHFDELKIFNRTLMQEDIDKLEKAGKLTSWKSCRFNK